MLPRARADGLLGQLRIRSLRSFGSRRKGVKLVQGTAETKSGTRISYQIHTPVGVTSDKRGTRPSLPVLMVHGFACGGSNWGAFPDMLAMRRGQPVVTFGAL